MSRILLTRAALVLTFAMGASGCVSTVVGATVGTAVGVTGAVVGTTAKVGGKAVGAAGRAVIPGDSRKDKKRDRDDD